MHNLKKILFVSPNFPPINAADMHRVRQLLMNFDPNTYQIDVIAIKPELADAYSMDYMLLNTIPHNYKVFHVEAIPLKVSKKIGIGSISMRSFFHFMFKGNSLIKKNNYDLIFFSTTATHVMFLGRYWKKKFNIPFVLDIQDPWVNDYYLLRPTAERPPKYMFNFKLDTYLESKTIPEAAAIISVSSKYNEYFKEKYNLNSRIILETIPFGVDEKDFQLKTNTTENNIFIKYKYTVLYIGRGGHDLQESIKYLFSGFKIGLEKNPELFKSIQLFFIGTSYASKGKGKKTIEPLAEDMLLQKYVTEITDRVSYFETINLLLASDILFIPGSIDEKYTPSKLYPYLLCKKPILAITNVKSEMNQLANSIDCVSLYHFNDSKEPLQVYESIAAAIEKNLNSENKVSDIPKQIVDEFSAKAMSEKVFDLFNRVFNSILLS